MHIASFCRFRVERQYLAIFTFFFPGLHSLLIRNKAGQVAVRKFMALSSLLECSFSLFRLTRDNVVKDTCTRKAFSHCYRSRAKCKWMGPSSPALRPRLAENWRVCRNGMNLTASIDDAVYGHTGRISAAFF